MSRPVFLAFVTMTAIIAVAVIVGAVLITILSRPKPAHLVLMRRGDPSITTRQVTPIYDPGGLDRACRDFPTRHQANIFFRAAGGPDQDPHGLDPDSDGVPCESLPTPTFMPAPTNSPFASLTPSPTPDAS